MIQVTGFGNDEPISFALDGEDVKLRTGAAGGGRPPQRLEEEAVGDAATESVQTFRLPLCTIRRATQLAAESRLRSRV